MANSFSLSVIANQLIMIIPKARIIHMIIFNGIYEQLKSNILLVTFSTQEYHPYIKQWLGLCEFCSHLERIYGTNLRGCEADISFSIQNEKPTIKKTNVSGIGYSKMV